MDLYVTRIFLFGILNLTESPNSEKIFTDNYSLLYNMAKANAKVKALLMHDYCSPENMETNAKGTKNLNMAS